MAIFRPVVERVEYEPSHYIGLDVGLGSACTAFDTNGEVVDALTPGWANRRADYYVETLREFFKKYAPAVAVVCYPMPKALPRPWAAMTLGMAVTAADYEDLPMAMMITPQLRKWLWQFPAHESMSDERDHLEANKRSARPSDLSMTIWPEEITEATKFIKEYQVKPTSLSNSFGAAMVAKTWSEFANGTCLKWIEGWKMGYGIWVASWHANERKRLNEARKSIGMAEIEFNFSGV